MSCFNLFSFNEKVILSYNIHKEYSEELQTTIYVQKDTNKYLTVTDAKCMSLQSIKKYFNIPIDDYDIPAINTSKRGTKNLKGSLLDAVEFKKEEDSIITGTISFIDKENVNSGYSKDVLINKYLKDPEVADSTLNFKTTGTFDILLHKAKMPKDENGAYALVYSSEDFNLGNNGIILRYYKSPVSKQTLINDFSYIKGPYAIVYNYNNHIMVYYNATISKDVIREIIQEDDFDLNEVLKKYHDFIDNMLDQKTLIKLTCLSLTQSQTKCAIVDVVCMLGSEDKSLDMSYIIVLDDEDTKKDLQDTTDN